MKRYWGVIIFHPRMPNFFGFVDTYEQCVNINYCEPKLSPRRWNFTSTALVGPTPGQPLATLTRSLAYYSQNRVRRRLQYFTTAYDNRTTSRRTAPSVRFIWPDMLTTVLCRAARRCSCQWWGVSGCWRRNRSTPRRCWKPFTNTQHKTYT